MATQALDKRDVEAKAWQPRSLQTKGKEQSNHKPKGIRRERKEHYLLQRECCH